VGVAVATGVLVGGVVGELVASGVDVLVGSDVLVGEAVGMGVLVAVGADVLDEVVMMSCGRSATVDACREA
jgi:hypothetical protein